MATVNVSLKARIVRVGSWAKAALVPKAAVSTEPMMIALIIVLPFKVSKVEDLATTRKIPVTKIRVTDVYALGEQAAVLQL